MPRSPELRSAGRAERRHVAQERDYEITFVAPSFEAFIRGLQPEDAFPDTHEIDDLDD